MLCGSYVDCRGFRFHCIRGSLIGYMWSGSANLGGESGQSRSSDEVRLNLNRNQCTDFLAIRGCLNLPCFNRPRLLCLGFSKAVVTRHRRDFVESSLERDALLRYARYSGGVLEQQQPQQQQHSRQNSADKRMVYGGGKS